MGGPPSVPQASTRCAAVLVAAPASGQGKTTVACALARLHARQGRRVRAFKCGPDFLDPFWLELASGAPVHQLDLWMTGEEDCRARLHAAAQEADLVIVEGVMGLFDGEPSAAELARLLGLPVMAVVDSSAMAGTFGALAYGLQHYQPGLRWAGVMANRVAGEAHAGMLQASLQDPAQWMGALPRDPRLALPERHLGLRAATEVKDALQRLDAAADALAATPLGQRSLAKSTESAPWSVDFEAPPIPAPAVATQRPLRGRRIAIARDAACCFIYAANLECLRALGAELVFFSPLQDNALPTCDAVWLPGGYPELHARRLAANTALRDAVRTHVDAGRAVWAECGGMMPLFDEIVLADGEAVPQWGLLPGVVRMQPRPAAIGPQQLALDGGLLRGHSFHYSTCETPLAPIARTQRPGASPAAGQGEAVYVQGSLRASYFHAWFPSDPAATASLFGASA